VLVAREAQELARRHRERGADVLRRDRQLPLAAIDQDREFYPSRAPVVEQLVHRRAHRAPGVEHVVDHDDVGTVDVEWYLRRLHLMVQPGRVEIVAIERNIERAHGRCEPEFPVQPLG